MRRASARCAGAVAGVPPDRVPRVADAVAPPASWARSTAASAAADARLRSPPRRGARPARRARPAWLRREVVSAQHGAGRPQAALRDGRRAVAAKDVGLRDAYAPGVRRADLDASRRTQLQAGVASEAESGEQGEVVARSSSVAVGQAFE